MIINPTETPVSDSRKRVLFIITQSEFGGAQRFLYNLLSKIDSKKIRAKVLVGISGDLEFLGAVQKLNIETGIIPHLNRDISPLNDLRAVFETRKAIKQFKPDTILLNSSKVGFIGSLAAQISKRTRVIYRIGGWSFNDPQPAWQRQLWILLERISARWKDVIVVNNQHDLDQAQRLHIYPRDKLALVHNGIDPYREFMTQDEAREHIYRIIAKRSGEIRADYVVGTIANFYPTKDLVTFIDIASKTKRDDTIFCIIGEGRDRATLEQKIIEKGLEKKVFLLGRVPDAAQYIPAFDVFLLTSVKEGFPWSVLEAMSAKVPVISTKVGAIPELIESGKNGIIIEPKDSTAGAHQVEELLSHESKRTDMVIQAHQTVLFKFNLASMVEQVESLL